MMSQVIFVFLFKPMSFDNDKEGESRIGILIYKTLVLPAKFNKTSVLVVMYVCFHVFFFNFLHVYYVCSN